MYRISTADFDIIKGYRADDSYTQVIEAFLLNQINIEEIKKLFYKGSLGNQIFLKSQKAFKQIEWKDAWQVYKDESDVTADFHAQRSKSIFFCKKPCNFAGRIRSSGNYGENCYGEIFTLSSGGRFL